MTALNMTMRNRQSTLGAFNYVTQSGQNPSISLIMFMASAIRDTGSSGN